MTFDGNIKRKELEEQSKPEYIPSVKHVRFLTGKTYKIKARLLHPIHEKLGLDEDVLKSWIEEQKDKEN